MRVRYDIRSAALGADYAEYEERDGDGPVAVTWIEDGSPVDWECDGYVVGGRLFLPSDGQAPVGAALLEDGSPDPMAHWYDGATGKGAILGIPGSALAVIV